MDLRTLRYFVAVAEQGTVSGAALHLHVTQPGLSRQLRQLERSLGVALFDRRAGRLALSSAGAEFLPVARELLDRANAAARIAAALAAGRLTSVRLAAPTTTLADVVAPFLATLGPDDPLPTVRELDPAAALTALGHGTDLAIVTEPPSADLASRALAVLPLWAYAPEGDPLTEDDVVTLAVLVAHDLVLMTRDFKPRMLLDAAMESAGLRYGTVVECTNAQVAQALAASRRGVAVVSDDPRFGLHGVRVVAPDGPVRIRLYAAWETTHHAADTLADLADRLAAFCVDRYGPDVAPAG